MTELAQVDVERFNARPGAGITGIHVARPAAPTAHELLREAQAVDLPFLQEMCYLTTYHSSGRNSTQGDIPTLDEAKAGDLMEIYLGGWGRRGDYGAIAVSNETGLKIGAAWYRRYVQRYPYELTIAVREGHRGQGVGGLLLRHLLDHADQHNRPEICLKVRKDNAVARRLYAKLGFVPISDEGAHEVMVASTACCPEARGNYSGVALA
jgi:GNAT superfamily N-acetyltransferase